MYVGWGVIEWYQEPKIIMVNVIPPDHVGDVLVVDLNQHDDVPVVPEPVIVDEDEDPKEDKFEEEEDPQEEEDDMEVDIEEDENEPELTYPYEETDSLNPPPPVYERDCLMTITLLNITANNLPLRGGHSIVDPSCDILSLGALYSWEFLLNIHIHACMLELDLYLK
ncbi:hypothetical protein Tco_0360047 [Tanacetum coccineum]